MATKNNDVKRAYRRTSSKKTRRRRISKDFHLIPDVLEASGVLWPAVFAPDNFTVLSQATEPGVPIKERIPNVIGAAVTQYTSPSELIPAAELVIVGMVAKWIGKKTGLNKIGTKRVKIL